jgi:hypothetical protein
MNKKIEKAIKFTGATAAELFDVYVKPQKHSILDGGAETKISAAVSEDFSLLNGNLSGKKLLLLLNRMIVQFSSGNVWEENDFDSIQTFVFSDTKTGAQICVMHSCTPKQFEHLWKQAYWDPIKEFLSKNEREVS